MAQRTAGSDITATENVWDHDCRIYSFLWLLPGLHFHFCEENTWLAQTTFCTLLFSSPGFFLPSCSPLHIKHGRMLRPHCSILKEHPC